MSDNPLLNPGGAPQIPDFQKKEEEKKKSGAAVSWGSGKQAFSGARASASAAGRAASTQPGAFGAASRLLGVQGRLLTLALTKGGMAAAASGLLLAASLGALWSRAGQEAVNRTATLGALRSTIKVAREVGDATGLAQTLKRVNAFMVVPMGGDAPKPANLTKPADSPAPVAEEPAADSLNPDLAGPGAAPEGVEGSVRNGKMLGKSGLHGVSGVFSKSGAMAIGQSKVYDRSKLLDFSKGDVAQGKMQGYYAEEAKKGKTGKNTKEKLADGSFRLRRKNIRGSSRALAQLRTMAPLNAAISAGGPVATEANAAIADRQFTGSGAEGAAAPAGPGADGATTPNPISNGGFTGGAPAPGPGIQMPECPDQTTPNAATGGCDPVQQSNVTPWQGEVDAINIMCVIASALLIAGAVLINAGNTPVTAYLKIIGMVLCGVAMGLGAAMIGCAISIAAKGGGMQSAIGFVFGAATVLEGGLSMAGKVSVLTVVLLAAIQALVAILGLALK